MGYRVVTFTATDGAGRAIYHTNVMMAVGTSAAVVCLECIRDAEDRDALREWLQSTGHEVIEITLVQVGCMAGNMLEAGPARCRPPRHHTRFEPSFLELNGVL